MSGPLAMSPIKPTQRQNTSATHPHVTPAPSLAHEIAEAWRRETQENQERWRREQYKTQNDYEARERWRKDRAKM